MNLFQQEVQLDQKTIIIEDDFGRGLQLLYEKWNCDPNGDLKRSEVKPIESFLK